MPCVPTRVPSSPAFYAAILVFLSTPAAATDDWPQYNGLTHDRSSAERVELRSWPEGGPPVAWTAETKLGFSSFSIAQGMAFTLVGRDVDGVGHEVCVALDTRTGEELWATALSKSGYDSGGDRGAEGNSGGDGPRSTPSHAGEQVFVFDAKLVLSCLDDETGELLWDRDIVEQFGGRNITWQSAASPLIDGGRVFLAGGGAGQSLMAIDTATGELLWKVLDERMTHATPIVATIHGVRQVIFFVQSGLVSVDPESGSELWRAEFPHRTSTAASPVVHEDIVYCSAGYGVGAGAFRISKKDDGFQATGLWRERNGLMNHWSTPVCKDGFLYGMFGFKDYGDGPLQCVDMRTGEVRWSKDGFGPGNCILVGSDLVALGDAGQVVLVEAAPEEYRELARAQVLDGKCWSTPVFSAGRLYVRSTSQAACLDLTVD
ncbi:MAG: PQQ-binding-like beta-propeller repeat protein [Planctomycetota bacterium]